MLFQSEDSGVAVPPNPPVALLTSDGKLVTIDNVRGPQIFAGNHAQHILPHDPKLANDFFARHATSH